MQQAQPGRAASIFGAILIVLGIFSFAYFASPIRIMLRRPSDWAKSIFCLQSLEPIALWWYRSLAFRTPEDGKEEGEAMSGTLWIRS